MKESVASLLKKLAGSQDRSRACEDAIGAYKRGLGVPFNHLPDAEAASVLVEDLKKLFPSAKKPL